MGQRDADSVIDQRETGAEGHLGLFKDYLSEPRFRIKLDDLVNANVRATILQMSGEKFPFSDARPTGADFGTRLQSYEKAVWPLQSQAALLGKWATPEQMPTLTNLLARMSDTCTETLGGNELWLYLRWYPLSLLMYSAGIASLSAENYPTFAAIHTKKINARTRCFGNSAVNLIVSVIDAMRDVAATNAWKCIEEYKQKRTPESEHLFNILRPVLAELLFLGASYEHLFDRYEILRSLIYADVTDSEWGPIGRFGWKYAGRGRDNPYSELCAEAERQGGEWGPIQAGLFRGSSSRFREVASRFEKDLLGQLQWF